MKFEKRNCNQAQCHWLVFEDNSRVFVSYYSPILIIRPGKKTVVSNHYNYSRTTSKQVSRFTNYNSATIKDGIKNGTVELVDIEDARNLVQRMKMFAPEQIDETPEGCAGENEISY